MYWKNHWIHFLKENLKIGLFFVLLAGIGSCKGTVENRPDQSETPPNIIIYFCDDLGYGDLGTYGSNLHHTPKLDALADAGLKLTGFYAAAGVCTPSRAGLLTGCYPKRVDMHVNGQPYFKAVLTMRSKKGLNPEEITLADLLKTKGYTTACLGKWHLGHQQQFLPTNNGFDYFYGFVHYSKGDSLPLYQNGKIIRYLQSRDNITQDLTKQAIDFISENKDNPFFLYLPNPMPHIPLGASAAFRGNSKNGIYGDAVEEIDWSVGALVAHLESLNLAQNTLIIFTSDNGAENYHRIDEPVGGRNTPLHEWKGSTFEGGFRVPCIMYWSGTIQPGRVSDELVTALDIFPTVGSLAGAQLPTDRIIDGIDMTDFITGKTEASPREVFYFYEREQLQAVRKGDWKLHLPSSARYRYFYKDSTDQSSPLLFELGQDFAEQNNQAKEKSSKLEELIAVAETARQDLGDKDIPCSNCREAGYIDSK